MKTQLKNANIGFILLCVGLLTGAFSQNASAQGKRVTIGTGSGELNYPNAQSTLNLKDGDTLIINAGVYDGITLSNITASPGKMIYVMNNGLVEITNSWVGFKASYLTNVDIRGNGTPGLEYGFYIHNMITRAVTILGRLTSVSFSYFRLENTGDYGVYLFDNSLTYTGDNSGLFYDLKFLHFRIFNVSSTAFQFGDWSHVYETGLTGMIRKLEIAYCDISNIPNDAEIIHLNKTVNANIHHNRIVHTGFTDTRHAGIIFLRGNGDVHHNYISDHWGNAVRGQGFGLDSIGSINVYNNVVVNSRKYSGVEANSFNGDIYLSPFTRVCNYRIFNNTFGNLSAVDWQASMVDSYNACGGTIEIKNNLGFNIQKDLPFDPTRNYTYIQLDTTKPDTAGNRYATNYAALGLIDDSSCLLNVNSPAIDKGVNFNWIKDDIDGVPRPQNGVFDIGAHEYQSGVVYPVSNAGSDIHLVLPTDSTTLDGTASYNPGGGVLKYAWSVVTGPTSFFFAGDTTATPKFSQLTPGTYVVKLVVTNSTGKTAESRVNVIVNAAPPPPVPNAGGDVTISLPTTSTALNGGASSNPTGGNLTYAWSQITGPTTVTITNGTSAAPGVSGLAEGVYTIKLTVTNAQGISASDTVAITVNPAPPPGSQPPVANAGTDVTITQPTNAVILNGGNSSQPDGTAITYAWTVETGPAGYAITGANTVSPTLGNLVSGTYQVRLTVTNITGLNSSDLVEITVNSQPTPVANAGSDVNVVLPASTATLNGSASHQPGGGSLTYAWSLVSGPNTPGINDATAISPALTGLVQGTYQYSLTVTNASGDHSSSTVNVIVSAAVPQNPVAKAGGQVAIVLPTNSVTLDGTGSYNPGGGSLTYAWVKGIGPSSFSISGANTATPVISNLAKGTYQLGLTVTNAAGLSASDIVTVIVTSGPVPVAKAGADTTVGFPQGFAILNGGASYATGGATLTSYAWSQVSGPTTVLFSNDKNVITSAGNLEPGDYIFQLTVTDNDGLSSVARVKVSVFSTLRVEKVITLYPNPCVDMVNMHLISDKTGSMTVRITSTAGIVVLTERLQKTQLQMDQSISVRTLASGSYILEVIIGNQVQLLQKFVKQ